VVVIGELDARIVRHLPSAVEDLRDALPVVERLAPFRLESTHDDVLVPDRLGRVAARSSTGRVLENAMCVEGCRESVSIEDRLDVGR